MKQTLDLFMLMANLSRLDSRETILRLFARGAGELFKPAVFKYKQKTTRQAPFCFEIHAGRGSFGFIEVDGLDGPGEDFSAVMDGAVRMLAIIIERLDCAVIYDDGENSHERMAALRLKELAKTVAELENARTASINLIEDLSMEIERRTAAEKNMIESRMLMEETERLARVGGWSYDVARGCMNWTRETHRIHGIDPGELTQGSPEYVARSLDCYDPEDRPVIMGAFRRCYEEGVPYDFEFPFTRVDGSRAWIRTIARPIIEDNRIVRVMGNIMDLTEQKQNRRSLETSEATHRELFNAVHDAIFIHDRDTGAIVDVNRPMLELYGYSLEEARTLTLADLSEGRHPYTEEEGLHLVKKAAAGEPQLFQWRCRRRDGSLFWGDISLKRGLIGGMERILAIVRDIDARKKAEADLLLYHEDLLAVLNSMEAFIYISDVDTYEVLFVNEYGLRAWGRDVIGQKCWQSLQVGMDGPCPFCTNKRLLDSQGGPSGVYQWEFRNTLDGRWYDCRDSLIRWTDGRLVRMEIATDITGRKEMELQRESALGALRQQVQEKELLLRETHHRIKNNIASIANLLMLQADTVASPDALSALNDAAGRVRSMGELYEKMLLSNEYHEVSARDYLYDLVDSLIPLYAGNGGVVVEKHVDDFALSSKLLFPLGIIVNELLTNAMKYAFSGRNGGTIFVSLVKSDDRARLVVRDTGRGLPEGFDSAVTGGFGLALVGMLAGQLGGTFRIANDSGALCELEFSVTGPS
jgi:PAS domain S-box-containing protein